MSMRKSLFLAETKRAFTANFNMYRLRDVYFRIILISSGAFCINAERSCELCFIYGCFDSSDTQLSLTLDGDEVFYADFKKEHMVWESRLPSQVQVSWDYDAAIHYRHKCKHDMLTLKSDKSVTKDKETPEIIVYPRDEVIKDEDNTLICFINHFFPPSINIKWTKNDVEVSVEDPFYKCLPNSDGTFYVLSTLDFVPKEGDIYSCTVEHESLEMPQTKFWGVEASEISTGPDVFCGLGLSLGLLGVAAGTFFFVKGKGYQCMQEA